MMGTRRIVLVVVVALLAAIPVAGLVVAATVTIAEGGVEFATAAGVDISSAKPNSTTTIFIRDDALETTKSGTAVFSGIPADSKFFDIANGTAGPAAASATSTGVTVVLTAADYASSSPSTTPLTGNPTAVVGTASSFVVGSDVDAGTFTILVAANATTTGTFSYHVQDVWTGTDSTLRRAKIISTSDPAGEYVTISEVASATDSTADATSRVFSGLVFLSSDAATHGTNSDGVWVQDADTVTVQYLDSAGTVLDSDTVTVDGVKPTIAGITPADGTVTNVTNPTVSFDVTDTGSGISTTNFSTDITLTINGTLVEHISFQAIADGFRGIFAQGTSWMNSTGNGGFAVTDSTEFSLTITATDQAGNTQTVETTAANITIDKTAPVLSSATTGSANTAIVVTFSDTVGLDATTVAASDFTISNSVTVSAAAVDADNKNVVNLTVSAMASDLKPTVTVSGISDTAGNTVAGNSQVTATDGIKPVISSVTIDKSLAVEGDVVAVALGTDEKMAVDWPKVSVHGPAGSTSNGLLTVTSPTPNNFSASTVVASGDTTGTYGVSIQVNDLGYNITENLTQVIDEAPTIDAGNNVLTLANGPIGDSNFNGNVAGSDVTVSVNGTTAGVTLGVVDASARTIEVTSGVVDTDAVLVTYQYTDDTFEVDLTAPTVAFNPASGANVATSSPVVSLIFDDDEYPGDSFKTVTVTSATLTRPDSSVVDILSSLTTSDNITYTVAASNLALGAHTITISASDVAGNQLAGAQSTFTVTNLAPVVVAEPNIGPDEGSTFAGTLATFTDTNAPDTHTAVVDWGDGTVDAGTLVESGGSGTVSGSHVYQDDDGGPFTVTITVTDDSNVSDSDTLVANVANVDPVADAGGNQSVAVGATFVLVPTTFTDVGVLDTHSALIVWGDGHSDTGTVDQTNDTVSGSHAYGGDGTFPLTVVVIDDDGGFAVDTIEVKVGSGIPKLPTAILSATQWALLLLTLAFGILLIRNGRVHRHPGR